MALIRPRRSVTPGRRISLTWNGAIENPGGPRLAFAYGMSPSGARGTGDALVASDDTLTRHGLVYRKVRGR